ncbi:MAG: phosphoglycerate kinase [Candidatus Yanofskybacteria bacterium]|nr:phosphoglycerate kinase [Candidatus Yanofskybacteria bacterium]
MKTIFDIPDLKNKKVLLRVDFDVPIKKLEVGGRGLEIVEGFRIKKQKEMIDWLVERGAKVVMIAHLHEDDGSFGELIPQLLILLGREVGFIKKVEDIEGYLANYPGVGLLDNIRNFPGEKENDPEFAKRLAAAGSPELVEGSKGFDIYVNNDFAVSHRNHASVSAITEFLPSYAGLLVKEEVTGLQKAIDSPKAGKVVIIGGAKAETKVPVIKNFVGKAELILLGGVVANDVLKARGQDMGDSVVDENYQELLVGLDINDPRLLVPEDFVVFDNKILDIGEKTIQKYADAVSRASVVIWNGPMGLFESSSFATGTQKIAEAVAESVAYKIIGGGDTMAAISKFRNIDMSKFNFISTGGGAMLAFLAGNKLSGLEALGYYNRE